MNEMRWDNRAQYYEILLPHQYSITVVEMSKDRFEWHLMYQTCFRLSDGTVYRDSSESIQDKVLNQVRCAIEDRRKMLGSVVEALSRRKDNER